MNKIIISLIAVAATSVALFAMNGKPKADAAACCPECADGSSCSAACCTK